MLNVDQAVVLRNKSKNGFLVVFSRRFGKIILRSKKMEDIVRLCCGMIFDFFYHETRKNYFLAEKVEVVFSPEKLDFPRLLWMHQVCELCYYFLPFSSPSQALFLYLRKTLYLILSLKCGQYFNLTKKIILLKTLEMLGFPSLKFVQLLSACKFDLASSNIDFCLSPKVKSLKIVEKSRLRELKDLEKEMDNYILECIQSHPLSKSFKAIYFPDVVFYKN